MPGKNGHLLKHFCNRDRGAFADTDEFQESQKPKELVRHSAVPKQSRKKRSLFRRDSGRSQIAQDRSLEMVHHFSAALRQQEALIAPSDEISHLWLSAERSKNKRKQAEVPCSAFWGSFPVTRLGRSRTPNSQVTFRQPY
jgi:hypothetical protein